MKLSIVTVVYNDKNHIEKTINSVINQTYNKIEYIIIDGKSTDGTSEMIEKYKEKITVYLREPDNGLYDAMNKSMKYITGDYVCFLNSGDVFYSENTVQKIFESLKNTTPDIIYGDAQIADENENIKGLRRHRPPENLNWKSFRKGMLVSHQSFIPSAKIIEPYDLAYKYSADYDWCIKIMKKTTNIYNCKLVIINFLDGGLTKKRMFKSLKERFKIMSKYYGIGSAISINFINAFKMAYFKITKGWF